jgi:hypothetical protein
MVRVGEMLYYGSTVLEMPEAVHRQPLWMSPLYRFSLILWIPHLSLILRLPLIRLVLQPAPVSSLRGYHLGLGRWAEGFFWALERQLFMELSA